MWTAVVFLLACMSQAGAYIQLDPVAYEQLLDGNGQLTLAASTRNKLAWDESTDLLYVISKEPRLLTVYSVTFEGTLTLRGTFALSNAGGDARGDPEAVQFCRPTGAGNARLAISFDSSPNPSSAGTVVFFQAMSLSNLNLNKLNEITVGANPVDFKFAENCMLIVVANQARPFQQGPVVTDEAGTVNRAMLPANLDAQSTITVDTINFSELEGSNGADSDIVPGLMAQNFRRWPRRDSDGNLINILKNVEPTSIEMAPNGQVAYVALPKNNAVARISFDPAGSQFFPFGNRSWSTFYMDASKADNAVHMENYRIYSTLQPTVVKWVTPEDVDYLITLDSGFLDDIPAYGYRDFEQGSNLLFNDEFGSSVDAQLREKLGNDSRLGEAFISTVDGRDTDGGQKIEDVFMFGGRGITIHDGQTLEVRTSLVDNLERVSAQFYKNVFNTDLLVPSNSPVQDRDATSPTLGPNLSVLETGFFETQKVMFLGSGSSGMIYIYVLVPDASCPQPFFHSVYRRGGQSSSWQQLYAAANIGDLGITDMIYIGNSEDHKPLLVVTAGLSNSVSIYEVMDRPDDLRKRREAMGQEV